MSGILFSSELEEHTEKLIKDIHELIPRFSIDKVEKDEPLKELLGKFQNFIIEFNLLKSKYGADKERDQYYELLRLKLVDYTSDKKILKVLKENSIFKTGFPLLYKTHTEELEKSIREKEKSI